MKTKKYKKSCNKGMKKMYERKMNEIYRKGEQRLARMCKRS